MKLKSTVHSKGVQPEIVLALLVADGVHRDLFKTEITVTSLNDSTHREGSLHYLGKAADIRTHDLTAGQRSTFKSVLQASLGVGYRVLIEDPGKPNEHMHLEMLP